MDGKVVSEGPTFHKAILSGNTYPVRQLIPKLTGGYTVWDRKLTAWVIQFQYDWEQKRLIAFARDNNLDLKIDGREIVQDTPEGLSPRSGQFVLTSGSRSNDRNPYYKGLTLYTKTHGYVTVLSTRSQYSYTDGWIFEAVVRPATADEKYPLLKDERGTKFKQSLIRDLHTVAKDIKSKGEYVDRGSKPPQGMKLPMPGNPQKEWFVDDGHSIWYIKPSKDPGMSNIEGGLVGWKIPKTSPTGKKYLTLLTDIAESGMVYKPHKT